MPPLGWCVAGIGPWVGEMGWRPRHCCSAPPPMQHSLLAAHAHIHMV
jgi:hypothetical protein